MREIHFGIRSNRTVPFELPRRIIEEKYNSPFTNSTRLTLILIRVVNEHTNQLM